MASDTFLSGNAGLSAAIENFFDRIESGVVDALSEGDGQSVGRLNVVDGYHLKSFEDGKRNAAGQLDGRGIERRSYRASPLQSQRGRNLLFRGETEFFNPFPDFSVTRASLGLEGGAHFEISNLAASDHKQPQWNTVGGLRRWSQGAQAR
ncbi:MAG: hypothetical protein ABSH31_23930 [Bryobacteraceae bacterium]